MSDTLIEVYNRLFAAYGPQQWWPGDGPFEVLVGAVLTQNTSWKNVEKAIRNLKEADLLDPHRLYGVPVEELEELIRPAGYFRQKARRLHDVLEYLIDQHAGALEAMFSTPMADLRDQLLAIRGIGPETADSILLYAGNLPSFVVDTYTHRVLARHGWVDFQVDYYELKDFMESQLPQDVKLYNEYHALLVRVGKLHCGKQPRCAGCPLEDLLPESGPLEPLS
ncbi:MAG TPA: endonuclease III domain-containing protein [Planctomycetaceae bacterium]|nr:endonuclease III domain-containing protein [Planctomycetaceae bacterium]HIQ20205.1 endonuclease III domain-containing protein [Planctomycetota bacterium]